MYYFLVILLLILILDEVSKKEPSAPAVVDTVAAPVSPTSATFPYDAASSTIAPYVEVGGIVVFLVLAFIAFRWLMRGPFS